MSRDHFQQIFWMMHVVNDTTEESSRAIKRTKKVHGVIEYTEKRFHFTPFLHQIFEQNSSLSGFAGI
jgi:dolichyl-phosphate-mannose--protein O-mannosyl transferase